MRYGHLLAFLIFLLALCVIVAMVLLGVSSPKKIDVTAKKTGETTITVSASPTSTPTGYYTTPVSSETATITYTEDGFSPSLLTIKAGTTVIFQNQSASQFWPASDPHPDHGNYPGIGSCNGQAFDPCAPVPAGTSWSLLFDKTGNWGYHNHLNPSHKGTILVK